MLMPMFHTTSPLFSSSRSALFPALTSSPRASLLASLLLSSPFLSFPSPSLPLPIPPLPSVMYLR